LVKRYYINDYKIHIITQETGATTVLHSPLLQLSSPVVPRHWQDLGYLIVYVTGRPDMQKQRVVAWLSQHNFPHGIVSFCDGLVHDPLRHKTNFLKSLTEVSRNVRNVLTMSPNLTVAVDDATHTTT